MISELSEWVLRVFSVPARRAYQEAPSWEEEGEMEKGWGGVGWRGVMMNMMGVYCSRF